MQLVIKQQMGRKISRLKRPSNYVQFLCTHNWQFDTF